MRAPLPASVSSTVSAPADSDVRMVPSTSTKPGGSSSIRAGLPGDDARTVNVTQFSSSATALTGARNDAHSLGCCSNAGGVVSSSKKRWSTKMSPTRFTPYCFSSWTIA